MVVTTTFMVYRGSIVTRHKRQRQIRVNHICNIYIFYLYQESYHGMVQCAALNCIVSLDMESACICSERCKIKKNMDSTIEKRGISAKSVHTTL
jgi:hypothetical protein